MPYPSDETIRMLRNVRDYAYTIYTRSHWIRADIEVIRQRPDWQTKAEEELLEALRLMDEAKAEIIKGLKDLQDKPVEPRQEG